MPVSHTPELHICGQSGNLFEATAEYLVRRIDDILGERGRCHLALAGGSTPRDLYELLATPEWRQRIDWQRMEIYFGDERCVPPDHPDSNYRMAAQSLLDPVGLPLSQRHRMRGEIAPHQAAAEYHSLLEGTLPRHQEQPTFDLVLLGMGPDGHTASLFPGTAILFERESLAAEVYVEQLDAWRISLTLATLNAAREVVVLVSGKAKAGVVAQCVANPDPLHPLPVARLTPHRLRWHLDEEAASLLDPELRERVPC